MARDLDIILFGASGFTGKHAIPIISKLTKTQTHSLTWGIAGRSEKKLQEILAECEKQTDQPLEDIPIIIASVEDEKSLHAMASKARIIINCCGPYRFFGEPVVKACVEEGTHHVDVSGEPQFIETMQLKYHKAAEEKGIYIVSACGVDSIPADMGVAFLEENFSGVLNSVTTYLECGMEGENVKGPAINYGTWESAVYGLAHADELRALRTQLYPTRLPKFEPKLNAIARPHKTDIVDGWVLPFLGTDRSIMRRTQRYFYDTEKKRPIQVETYFIVKSFLHVILFAIFGALFGLLTKVEFGRKLLLKYPEIFSAGLFSHEQPSEEKISKTWFSITLHGEGWKEKLAEGEDQYTTPPDASILAKVKGINPGYGATCVALVLSGITILTEKDKLPSTGGVFPPGAAFARTSLIKQLNENGLTFEILPAKNV